MKDVFARLGADFFSTILFLAIYLATDNVLLATGVAIAGAVAQVIYARVKGKPLAYMTYASLALVIVLGSATLLTHDPRFVLASVSPSGHYAIDVSGIGTHGYQVGALASGTQAGDLACRSIRLGVDGANATHASGTDATSANPEAPNRACWSL